MFERVPVAVCVVLASLFLVPAAAAEGAGDALVIAPVSVEAAGWSAQPISIRTAERQFDSGLPAALVKLVARSQAEATAAVRGGEKLSSEAFVVGTAAGAGKLLSAWKRVNHAAALARLGTGGSIVQSTRHGTKVISLAWRDQAQIAYLRLQLPARTKGAESLALSLAALVGTALGTSAPSTAFGQVASQIEPDGSVSSATALGAFALAYGGLPGVSTPSGSGTAPGSQDGELAAAWALDNISSFSAADQAAIYADLGLAPPDAQAHDAAAAPTCTPDPALTTQATNIAATYAGSGRLGVALKYTIAACTTTIWNGTGTNADAFPVDAKDHYNINGPTCRIRFNATKTGGAGFVTYVLSHEIFHCFQFMIAGEAWKSLPAWTLEGTAEWAGLTNAAASFGSSYPNADSGWVTHYLATPSTPLFQRTYDAVGFWGHVQDVYGNLWSRFQSILTASGSTAIFKAATSDTTGSADPFMYSWASSEVDGTTGGAAWHMTSPVTVPAGSGVNSTNITYSASAPTTYLFVAPYTTKSYIIVPDPAAPLVHIQLKGHARFSSKYDYTTQLAYNNATKGGWFCQGSASVCTCPSGTSSTIPAGYPDDGPSELEPSGDPVTGTGGTVTYSTLAAFCKSTYQIPAPSHASRRSGRQLQIRPPR